MPRTDVRDGAFVVHKCILFPLRAVEVFASCLTHRPLLCCRFVVRHLNDLSFRYESTLVEGNVVVPVEENMQFKTERTVGKVGVMLVGLGGNNGW